MVKEEEKIKRLNSSLNSIQFTDKSKSINDNSRDDTEDNDQPNSPGFNNNDGIPIIKRF